MDIIKRNRMDIIKRNRMKIFTVSNTEANIGYSSNVKVLAEIFDEGYNKNQHHIDSTTDGRGFKEEKLSSFIEKIEKEIALNNKICILFAGGNGWNERIRVIQKILKEKLLETLYKKIKFVLDVERINDSDEFNKIESLFVITQEKEEKMRKILQGNENSIKIHTVDISACTSKELIEKEATNFKSSNSELSEELREKFSKASHFFYLGGRGEGFSEKNKNIKKEYLKFIDQTFTKITKNEPLIIFTHGIRTFTNLDGTNNFEPIDNTYQYIREHLAESQEAYIFSQNGKNSERIRNPILIKINKSKREETEIKGNAYNWSLLFAKENGLTVTASEEQQNFPLDALTVGISQDKIDSIQWELQAENHNKIYEIITDKNLKLTTAETSFKEILDFDKKIVSCSRCTV